MSPASVPQSLAYDFPIIASSVTFSLFAVSSPFLFHRAPYSMPPSYPALLYHPTLNCRLRGKLSTSGSTIQYRGLKYAHVTGRWKDAILLDGLTRESGGIHDATKWGPSCPQKRGGQAFDISLVGDVKLEMGEGQGQDEKMDESDCLNLVVTVPNQAVALKRDNYWKGWPVVVWVHGGGLSMGSNSWPQYDLEKFVARSVEIGKPVIGVSINYRLNIFGFLASTELGISGNYGYKDQVLAFKWIKSHVAGFGGDPNNVTAMGESAGSISISTLLSASDDALFTRAIMMSGDATLRKPRRKHWHNAMYEDNIRLLRFDTLTATERVKAMTATPAEELAQKLPLAQHFCATVDGKFLKGDVDLGILSNASDPTGKPRWCQEIVLGDCLHDCSVLKGRLLDNPAVFDTLHALCRAYLPVTQRSELLQSYNLTLRSEKEALASHILSLASDVRFYLPVLQVAAGWTKRRKGGCYTYHFHQINPVSGTWRGLASHELDVAFLLQHFNTQLPAGSADLARGMADTWIDFICGNGWPEENDRQVVVLGDDKSTLVTEAEYDEIYRQGHGELMQRLGWDKLFGIMERLQGVRPDEETFTAKI